MKTTYQLKSSDRRRGPPPLPLIGVIVVIILVIFSILAPRAMSSVAAWVISPIWHAGEQLKAGLPSYDALSRENADLQKRWRFKNQNSD